MQPEDAPSNSNTSRDGTRGAERSDNYELTRRGHPVANPLARSALPPELKGDGQRIDGALHTLCWSSAMCFSTTASFENKRGSISLASNAASRSLTNRSRVAAKYPIHKVLNPIDHDAPGVALVPSLFERLDDESDDEIALQIRRLGVTALLSPSLPGPDLGPADPNA